MTRVVIVGPRRRIRGGISQFTNHLSAALAGRAEVEHISFRRLYPWWTRPGRDDHDPSQELPPGDPDPGLVAWRPFTWWSAARRLRAAAPDLLIYHWWHPAFGPSLRYLSRRAKNRGARVVAVCHNHLPHERIPFARWMTRRTLSEADVVIALSDWTAERLKELAPSLRIRSLQHPPFLYEPSPGAAREWSRRARPGDPTILFFGYVRPYKGLEDLVRSMSHVRRRFPDAVLVVAGPFLERVATYRRLAERLGVADAVRLLDGYVPNEEVPAVYSLADVVALPYRSATQSGVLPQARAAGKRVVATAVGGVPESAGPGVVLVPPRDPRALAEGIAEALSQPPPVPESGGWEAWRDALLEEAGVGRAFEDPVRGRRQGPS